MNFQRFLISVCIPSCVAVLSFCFATDCVGQDKQLQQALNIKPGQMADVDFDQPTGDQLKSCKVTTTSKPRGFLVHDTSGRILRKFIDSNGKKLDRWSYYKNGLEVYRDIDSDFDGKTDSCRWVGAGGTRWGLDPDQNGTIDSWKVISAEEVGYEVFQAIKLGKAGDAKSLQKAQKRFERLLLTPNELQALGLGKSIRDDVEARLKNARANFAKFCRSQKEIGPSTKWVHAGNGQPSMSPEGANSNRTNIVVYDHATGVFQSRDYGQIALGSIVQVGSVWRMIELPEIVSEGKAIGNGGAFFPMPQFGNDGGIAGTEVSPEDEQAAELYESLDKIETRLKTSEDRVEIAKLEAESAKIKEQFYFLTKDPERKRNWLENLADTAASSYQNERYPEGIDYLKGFIQRLNKAGVKSGQDLVSWRVIYAEYAYATDIGDRKADAIAQQKLMDDFKDFQAKYKSSPLSANALCQLGVDEEINDPSSGNAIKYYQEAVARFPNTSYGKRARGALKRLKSKGRPISLVGEDLNGRKFDLQDPALRGKVVVIHFWETWCADGLDDIQRLKAKHKNNVVFVGCNIESSTDKFKAYLSENRDLTWIQLHAPGGMEESPLAHQLGIASEPAILVIDKKGNLVDSDIALGDLDRTISRQLRK